MKLTKEQVKRRRMNIMTKAIFHLALTTGCTIDEIRNMTFGYWIDEIKAKNKIKFAR